MSKKSIFLKTGFYALSIIWTAWLIFKSKDTICFNIFDGYMTIFSVGGSMILNDFIR